MASGRRRGLPSGSSENPEQQQQQQQQHSASAAGATGGAVCGYLEAGSKPSRNKPPDTKLRQQKLPAWQPILTAATVIPTVFGVGIVFLPIGIALYLATEGGQPYFILFSFYNMRYWSENSRRIEESKVLAVESVTEYTSCTAPSRGPCKLIIQLDTDYKGDVYFYYGLDNYYQNHRRYMKSRSDSQLLGDVMNVGDCEPFARLNTSSGQKVIAPCGAVANSMFNGRYILLF
ncbi:unnamed protein product [Gongylonema pulchrum]|uniref:Transmembrane protein 30A n=1 Tax=Gongylonema pulchrum TaxID=637853 RepID=A0A183ECI2_9BILA|nr:unnamed protein product [Gongylonema pulchrum]